MTADESDNDHLMSLSGLSHEHVQFRRDLIQQDLDWRQPQTVQCYCVNPLQRHPGIKIMWVKQCHKAPMTGNGEHTNYLW